MASLACMMSLSLQGLLLGAKPLSVTRAPQIHATRAPQIHAMAESPVELKRFLADLEFLGPVRFVVVGPGAILEAIGSFENLRTKETPKGLLATVSNEDNSFECHVRCNEIAEAQFIEKPGEKTMYIIRLLSDGGDSLLSAILHAEDGEYEEGAVDFWQVSDAAAWRPLIPPSLQTRVAGMLEADSCHLCS